MRSVVNLDNSPVKTTITADDTGNSGASHVYTLTPEGKTRGEQIIRFQDGGVQEVGVNGITNEALLSIVVDRLRGFQAGPFNNEYNAVALVLVEQAISILNARTADREARGVEGKQVP